MLVCDRISVCFSASVRADIISPDQRNIGCSTRVFFKDQSGNRSRVIIIVCVVFLSHHIISVKGEGPRGGADTISVRSRGGGRVRGPALMRARRKRRCKAASICMEMLAERCSN